ncbi:MAG: hypothetical protein KVP17_001332 [Porospora cf. gigantea B]|uniref:uncharacterized protein n=1 Tax=Porospora cf. gigantea B TaxID=2853592 RepID=UPI003571E6E0|nr:MAG: hypothetical protein KVP17_001332 [Porospora cf. gigantea B]
MSLPSSAESPVRLAGHRSKVLFVDDEDEAPASARPLATRPTCSPAGLDATSSESTSSFLSSSADESSSASVTSSSSKAQKKKKTEKRSPKRQAGPRRSKKGKSSSSSESGPVKIVKELKKKGRKEALIAELLCRWWYVLPEWPPPDFDYEGAAAKRKLKVVPFEMWEDALDVDREGWRKVYPVGYFPGVYRNSCGEAIDIRPLEGKPCFSNFRHRNVHEVRDLLVTALSNQLECLQDSKFAHTDAAFVRRQEKELQQKLEQYRALKL